MGKRKVFNCIYCARQVTGRHHAIALKNEYTHDVKAGLSLRWAHMGFFCLIDAFMFHFRPKIKKFLFPITRPCVLKLPLLKLFFFNFTIDKIPNLPRAIRSILPVQFMYINAKIEMEMM